MEPVVVMRLGEHWEPPQPRPLLITVHSLADRLGVTLDKAYGLSYCLGRFYYGASHTHVRVLAWRVDQLEELVQSGMTLSAAAEMLYHDGADTFTRPSRQERVDYSWGRVRRRRRLRD